MQKSLYVSWVASSRERAGHWFWYHRALKIAGEGMFTAGLRVRGLDVDFPVLPRSSYRRGFSRFPRWVLNSTVRALSRVLSKEDFDSSIIYEGQGFEFQVAVELAKRHPSVSFFLNLSGPSSWSRVLESRDKARTPSIQCECVIPKNVFLSADNAPMARYLSDETELPVSVFPVFSTQFVQSMVRPEKALSCRDEFGVSIGSRSDLQFALAACQALVAEFPRKKFHIIFQPRAGFSQKEIDDFGKQLAVVTGVVLYSFLDSTKYSEILRNVSAMALIYSPIEYSMKSSGRLEDCLLFGVVPIVAKGTAMSNNSELVWRSAYDWADPESVVSSFRLVDRTSDSSALFPDKGNLPSAVPLWVSQTSQAQGRASCPVCLERQIDLVNGVRIRESFIHELGNSLVRAGLRLP